MVSCQEGDRDLAVGMNKEFQSYLGDKNDRPLVTGLGLTVGGRWREGPRVT